MVFKENPVQSDAIIHGNPLQGQNHRLLRYWAYKREPLANTSFQLCFYSHSQYTVMQLPHETTQKNWGYCLLKRMHFHYFYFLPFLCSGLNLHGAMAKVTEFWVYTYIGTKSIMFRSSETIISLLLKKSCHIIRSDILYMKFCPCTCPNTLNGCDVSLCTIYEFWLILWIPCIVCTELAIWWLGPCYVSHTLSGSRHMTIKSITPIWSLLASGNLDWANNGLQQ